jgi:hypothetical protein
MRDYTTLLQMRDAPSDMKVLALYNRGCLRRDSGDTQGALQDFSTLIDLPGAPAKARALGLHNRGCLRARNRDFDAAMVDLNAVVEMPDAPDDVKESAAADLRQVEHDAGRSTGDKAWATTPYDDYQYPPRHRPSRPTRDFDFFISYKSEDASLVRRVADMLVANGFKVWFAEYTILLTDRGRFAEAIEDGIRRSKFGLAFTRDLYVASEHCRDELNRLLDPSNCGPGKVLEIRLRNENLTHEAFPQLVDSPQFQFNGDVDSVLEFVGQSTAREINTFERSTLTVPANRIYRDERGLYALDIGGWGRANPGDLRTDLSCKTVLNGYNAHWNLLIGPFIPGTRQAYRMSEAMDERTCYNFILEFVAREFLTLPMVQGVCRGAHMLSVARYSQAAITYWFEGMGSGYWTRRHSVVFPDSNPAGSTEFAFTFAFFGPFREYCRHAYLMDHLVESLRFESATD